METNRMRRLILARKRGEMILIGDNVRVTLLRISRNVARLMIEAPQSVRVIRKELQEDSHENHRKN